MQAIPPSATAKLVKLARDLGSWRRPVSRSSSAKNISGLICCGQRCDLDFVFASFGMNVRVVRDNGIIHLPFLLLVAVGGIVVHIAARSGICFAKGVWFSTRVTSTTGYQADVVRSSLCWQALWSIGRSRFIISIIIILSPTRCVVAAFACHEAVVFKVEPHDAACSTHHVHGLCLGQRGWISSILLLLPVARSGWCLLRCVVVASSQTVKDAT